LDERISLMPEVEIDYMEKHPPSCVGANVASAPTELRNLIRRDYGAHTTVFALRCLCGGDHFGVSFPDDGFGTVSIKCVSCGSQRIVFDPLKHGYDGALGLNQGVGMGPSAAGACPKCKLGTFQLATGFQYSGETDILEQKKLDIKPEDLFDSFVLGGRCTSCGESSILIDLECA
jgi:hypothetical protein